MPKSELKQQRRETRGLMFSVGIFSVFVNILMLTGSLYMLQVYDRVLSSGSVETLIALSGLVVGLYAIMGILDYIRGRVAARIGAAFQAGLDARVFGAQINRTSQTGVNTSSLADLEAIQRYYSSPILFALFDIFFSPLFLAAIFMFHSILGYAAIAGTLVLVATTILNQFLTKNVVLEANKTAAQANAFSEDLRSHAELVRGLGMSDAALQKWQKYRDKALSNQISSSDLTGTFTSFSKSFRFLLQSAMLGLGAYLTLQGLVTAGAMIASSIMLGRALAPIEQLIGQWPMLVRKRQAWKTLDELLAEVPKEPQLAQLERPEALLRLEQVSVVPPGTRQLVLQKLSFELKPGQVLGVIGQSASGKSSLAKILTGIWKPASGKIRLDGATLDQYSSKDLGNYIGYLPQDVTLFSGTIAENISRMEPDAPPEKYIKAAKMAGAHDLIKQLDDGYNTLVNSKGGVLSGGQKQRIGLARAMYGDPVIMVLDEPNSNLDAQGQAALDMAIKNMIKNKAAVVMMVHREAALEVCDLAMVLHEGVLRGFGPLQEIKDKFFKRPGARAGNGQQARNTARKIAPVKPKRIVKPNNDPSEGSST